MYLHSSSPEVSKFVDALGANSEKVLAVQLTAVAGQHVICTLEQTVHSNLLNGPRDLSIDYKLIRRDYAELLEPLIEKITGMKEPKRSELEIALKALGKCLDSTD
jgi:hypothetical protein